MRELVEKTIDSLRRRLLDLTNRNRLLNYKHSDRSRTHIRVIDELPNILYGRLEDTASLTFKALPEPEGEPKDEHSDEFLMSLEEARLADEEYMKEILELGVDDDGSTKKAREIERRMKDRLRERLGMPPRKSLEVMSIAQYAQQHGFNSDYDMPLPDGTGRDPTRHTDNYIQTMLLPEDMDRKLSAIQDKARSVMQETGVSTLYCAFGFLQWFESNNSEQPHFAPLLLYPVEIEKEKVRNRYRYKISSVGNEVEPNLTLSERLSRDFGLSLPSFEEDDTPEKYFDKIAEIIKEQKRWQIRRFITIGHFAFARLVMYQDLNQDRWSKNGALADHPILSKLFLGSNDAEPIFGTEYDVDNPEIAKIVPLLVMDADSSQHSALVDAVQGNNLVIEGPPGTGKSQTIVNLIAAALSTGQRVLFVAEKMAALEVVKARLDGAGLGEFCFEIHSTKARKRDVLESLETRLKLRSDRRATEIHEQVIRELEELKTNLKIYVDTLNRNYGRLGKTIQQLLWAELRSRDKLKTPPPNLDRLRFRDASEISPFQVAQAKARLGNLEKVDRDFRKEYGRFSDHPWYGIQNYELNRFQMEDLERYIIEWSDSLDQIKNHIHCANILLGFMPAQSLREAKHFIDSVSSLSLKPDELNQEIFGNLTSVESREASTRFIAAVKGYRDAISSLGKKFNDPDTDHELKATRLDSCAQIFEKLKLTSKTKGAIPDEAALLCRESERIGVVAEYTINLSREFELEVDPTIETLNLITQAINCLLEIDLDLFGLSSPEAIDAKNLSQLESGRERSEHLLHQRSEISKILQIPEDLSPTQLRGYAGVLRSSGMFSAIVSSLFREAKRTFKTLQVDENKRKPIAMGSVFLMLAEYLEIVSKFENDSRLKAACGRSFDGIDTPYEALLTVNHWASYVRNALPEKAVDSLKIQEFLLSRSPDRLQMILEAYRNADQNCVREVLSRAELLPNENLSDAAQVLADKYDAAEKLYADLEEIGVQDSVATSELHNLTETCRKAIDHRQGTADNDLIHTVIGDDFNGVDTELSSLNAALAKANEVVNTNFGGQFERFLISREVNERWVKLLDLKNDLDETYSHIISLANKANELGRISFADFCESDSFENVEISGLKERLSRCLADAGSLVSYVEFLRGKQEVDEPGLSEIVECFEVADQPFEHLQDAYDHVLYRSIIRSAHEEIPELNRFSGLTQQEARDRFRDLDRKILDSGKEHLAAELAATKIEHGIGVGLKRDWTDRALILNELSKKKRHISLRALLDRASTAIQQMKPCFMMSPLSVSQYLKPGELEFDLLVIDEASQMRPEFSLGAIARSKQIVVVGDPKQLPPTSFFDRLDDTELDEDEDEGVLSESILDLGLSVFRPARRLRWHYRSQHESLIAFSNNEFYGRELIIFPSPYEKHDDYGVSYEKIEGLYRGRMNVPEAQRVVEATVEFMHKNPNSSLGIVALNQMQRDLIVDEMDRIFARDSICDNYRAKWDGTLFPFIVKNLENIQGDERDVIFISTVYGPDDSGRVLQRFGPINSETGHRRLNVLFTRARKRVVIFSSMYPGEIRADENSRWGVRALRGYLEYAMTGRLEVGTPTVREPDSDFEIWVKERLEQFGYEVVPQVGVKGFFIDLAVRHPNRRGSFILGIECDGATYHSAKSARDRDRLRQEVLENLGWEIHRVWSTDWFRNPQREIEKVKDKIERLRAEDLLVDPPPAENRVQRENHSGDDFVSRNGINNELGELAEEHISQGFEPVLKPEPVEAPPTSPDEPVLDDIPREEQEPVLDDLQEQIEPVVEVGDKVTYVKLESPEENFTRTIVNGEYDPEAGTIGAHSPIALAILDMREGEETDILTPNKPVPIRVIKIEKLTEPPEPDPPTVLENYDEEETPTPTAGFRTTKFTRNEVQNVVQPYNNWENRALPDPKNAPPPVVLRGLLDIIETEGPIVVLRSYQIYAKSAGISRVGKSVRSALNRALAIGISQKAIEIEDELGNGGQIKSVVRLPDTPTVILRTLGDRTLEEIPASEVAHVMKILEEKEPITDKNDFFRNVLNHYELRRMTSSAINHLENIFQRYRSSQEN